MIRYFHEISDPTPMLIVKALEKLGDDDGKWWEWEPETIEDELPGDIPKHRMTVIMSVAAAISNARGFASDDKMQLGNGDPRTLIVSSDPLLMQWKKADIFGDTCVAFNGVSSSFEYLQMPTLGEIWYTLEVLKGIEPKTEDLLSEEVQAYIAGCMFHHGLMFCPWEHEGISRYLRNMLRGGHEVADEAKRLWHSGAKSDGTLTAVNVQIMRMAAAEQYKNERVELGKRQIVQLS